MRFSILFVLLLTLAGHAMTADSVTLGGTAPSVSLTVPAAGQVFAVAVNSASTISYSTDLTLGARKITVAIDDLAGGFPAGTRVRVTASPGTGQGTGYTVTLSTTAGDLIRDVNGGTTVNDLPLTFEFTPSLEAAPGSSSRTIRYTILMQ